MNILDSKFLSDEEDEDYVPAEEKPQKRQKIEEV